MLVCPKCNKEIGKEIDIGTFSEDGATVTEVRCKECFHLIESMYIGNTDWELNRVGSKKRLEEFLNKYKQE